MSAAIKIVPVLALLVVLTSCGGSSSGGSSGSGSVGEITTLADVPTSIVDPSEYDVSTNTALSSISASPAMSKAQGDLNTFSRAGCETDRMKKNVIRNALLPKMILCMMQAFETAAGTSAAGDGVFNLWKGSDDMIDEGPPGVDEFKPRMAIKKGSNDLTFVMCNDTTKAMELYISTANNQYSGYVIDKWGDGFENKLEFTADGLPTTASGAAGFTTATFTQQMNESSNYWTGFGLQTFEATPNYNTVYGFYNEQGSNNYAGSVYARFDSAQGTARYRQDSEGSYSAWNVRATFDNCEIVGGVGGCGDFEIDWLGASGWLATECGLEGLASADLICFSEPCVEGEICCPSFAASDTCSTPAGNDNTESFTITLLDSANHILNFALAGTSDYAAAVAAAAMPDSSIAPVIEFTSASADVDCGGSANWTPLTFASRPDTTECDAIQAELDDWDTGELCQTLDAAASGGLTAQQ